MRIIIGVILFMFLMARCSESMAEQPWYKPNHEEYLNVQHQSSIFRGEPFNPHRDEFVVDSLNVCTTLTWFRVKSLEVDVCEGMKRLNWSGAWEESSSVSVKWYFGRRK